MWPASQASQKCVGKRKISPPFFLKKFSGVPSWRLGYLPKGVPPGPRGFLWLDGVPLSRLLLVSIEKEAFQKGQPFLRT